MHVPQIVFEQETTLPVFLCIRILNLTDRVSILIRETILSKSEIKFVIIEIHVNWRVNDILTFDVTYFY